MVAATPRSLIFDCDGVLSDTEPYGHLPAFNRMFAEFGLPVHWTTDEYAKKLLIGGGKERLATLLTPEFVTAAGLPQSSRRGFDFHDTHTLWRSDVSLVVRHLRHE